MGVVGVDVDWKYLEDANVRAGLFIKVEKRGGETMGNGDIGIVCFFSWLREGERKKERKKGKGERGRERALCRTILHVQVSTLDTFFVSKAPCSVSQRLLYVCAHLPSLFGLEQKMPEAAFIAFNGFPFLVVESVPSPGGASSASPHSMAKWCCQRLSNRRHGIDRLRRPATSSGEAGKRKDV